MAKTFLCDRINPQRFIAVIFACTALLFHNPLISAEREPLVIDYGNLDWSEPGGGNGTPLGLQTKRVDSDEAGGITYYARFPAGTHFDLHWHTHHEFVVVISGAVTLVMGEDSHELEAGNYVVIPGKMNHSWDIPDDQEVVILVRRAGPADFHFLDN